MVAVADLTNAELLQDAERFMLDAAKFSAVDSTEIISAHALRSIAASLLVIARADAMRSTS